VSTAGAFVAWAFSGVGVTVIGLAIRAIRSRRRKPLRLRSPELDELKAVTKVLVIDDQPFEFIKPLRSNGFKISHVSDVRSTNDIESGKFDVVLPDLHGVGTSLSDDQGLGLLRQLKQASPAIPVIAYSSARWPLSAAGELELANEVLDKARASLPDFRQVIELNLVRSASIDHYVECLMRLCPSASSERVTEALKQYVFRRDPTAPPCFYGA
jgi:CheY-like chemotaxis protein